MRYKAYLAYKPSGIEWLGEVPGHWEVKRLKYSALRADEKVEADPDNTVPYVGLEHIEPRTGRLLPLDSDLIPAGVSNRFRAGDTLFGKLRPYLAKACNVNFDGLCSSELLVLRTTKQDPRFLLYRLLADGFISLVDASTYGAKMPRAGWDFIGACPLPVPSIHEQCAIADFLDAQTAKLDTLVAKKRVLIEKLKEKRTALISRTVTRGLPPDAARTAGLDPHPNLKASGVDWLGDVPQHWDVMRLRYVGDAVIGLTFDPADVVDEDDGTLVLRASNVSGGQIVLEDNLFVNSKIPGHLVTTVGDILICSRSGSRALIGKNAKITEESAGLTFGTFMMVFRSVHNDYLFYVFNSTLFDYQSSAFLTSTINQLTISNLYSFEVPIPPPAEQKAIAIYLGQETAKINQMIAKIEAAIERLQEYRTALITAAVTGKIDVRGMAHEPN